MSKTFPMVKLITRFRKLDETVVLQETQIDGLYEPTPDDLKQHGLAVISLRFLEMLIQDSDTLANMRSLSNQPYRATKLFTGAYETKP